MPKSARQNLTRGVGGLSGDIVEDLNAVGEAVGKPGLGTKLAREVNVRLARVNTRLDAQAGHRGTVAIAEQQRSSSGDRPAALDVQGGRITGVPFPKDGTDAINLDYLRNFKDCHWFEQMHEDCIEEALKVAPSVVTTGIIPWFFGYMGDPPNAADIVNVDGGSSGRISIWPQSISSPARVSHVVIKLPIFTGTVLPEGEVGFALYDGDRNLVCDTGGYSIVDGTGTHYKVGVQVIPLRQETVDIPAGGYFFCYVANQCFNIYMWRRSIHIMDIWNELVEDNLHAVGSGWVGSVPAPALNPIVFPDTLDVPTDVDVVAKDVPIALFALNGFGV